jgi:hypothetical protein
MIRSEDADTCTIRHGRESFLKNGELHGDVLQPPERVKGFGLRGHGEVCAS